MQRLRGICLLPRTNNCIWNPIYFHICAGLGQLTVAAFSECSVLTQYKLNNSHVTHKMKTGVLITYLWAFIYKCLCSLKLEFTIQGQIQEKKEREEKPKLLWHPSLKPVFHKNEIHIRYRMLGRSFSNF